MTPQANFERVLATCQATGAKMMLPLIASCMHRMVAVDNLTLALLYTAMQQLNVYQAKAAEIQLPSTLQVPNSWWVDSNVQCPEKYTTWPLQDIISEAKGYFPLEMVCFYYILYCVCS